MSEQLAEVPGFDPILIFSHCSNVIPFLQHVTLYKWSRNMNYTILKWHLVSRLIIRPRYWVTNNSSSAFISLDITIINNIHTTHLKLHWIIKKNNTHSRPTVSTSNPTENKNKITHIVYLTSKTRVTEDELKLRNLNSTENERCLDWIIDFDLGHYSPIYFFQGGWMMGPFYESWFIMWMLWIVHAFFL